jgi:hypothetical protein
MTGVGGICYSAYGFRHVIWWHRKKIKRLIGILAIKRLIVNFFNGLFWENAELTDFIPASTGSA